MLRINCIFWFVLSLIGILLVNRKSSKPKIVEIEESQRSDSKKEENNEVVLISTNPQGDMEPSQKKVTSSIAECLHESFQSSKGQFKSYKNSEKGEEMEGLLDKNGLKSFNVSQEEEIDVPFGQALRDYRIYIVTFAVCLSLVQGTFVSFVFKNYGLENIPNDAFITTVGTIGAIMNGISRSFWGILVDKFPYKYVFGSLLLIQIVLGFTIQLVVSNKILYLIWIALSYFCLGGHFSMTPTVCAQLYGAKTGSRIYSLVFFFLIPPGIIALVLSQSLYHSIGYGKIFYITGGMTCISFVALMFFKSNPKV
mmetsp:Transcript_18595/g.16473  ORF Transcript_18595/g.16473 Transcript_18595/m.16473 type:complete len:310 (+) Transcript_18595:572-1501(+)